MSTKKWVLDPVHSELQFKVKHMMVTNVTGGFTKFNIEVTTQSDDLQNAQILFRAETDSVSTGNPQRDEHLKSGDFLNAKAFPEITFKSATFRKLNAEEDYELTGELTISGVSRPVKLQVNYGGTGRDPWGNTKAGFSLTGKINRKDWGLNYNAVLETGGVLVSDEVRILAEIQMVEVTEEEVVSN